MPWGPPAPASHAVVVLPHLPPTANQVVGKKVVNLVGGGRTRRFPLVLFSTIVVSGERTQGTVVLSGGEREVVRVPGGGEKMENTTKTLSKKWPQQTVEDEGRTIRLWVPFSSYPRANWPA